MPCSLFDPTVQIPSLTGEVILVTGGTAGLGCETVLSFASHDPTHIFFTGRSQASADKLIQEVESKHPGTPITFVPCDLANLSNVQQAAMTFLSKTDRLDIAMMNAGVMALPPGQTKDGYEIQFGTNHVGQALLLKLLTPLLGSTAASSESSDVRIVWLTSLGYKAHPKGGILFDKVTTPQTDIAPVMGEWMRYGQSKLANLLYARAYAKHYPSMTSVSVHPGVSVTGLVNSLSFMQRMLVYVTNLGKMISPEECAWNQQWAATAPEVESGRYYEPIGVKTTPSRDGANDELAERLWEWTEKELENYRL